MRETYNYNYSKVTQPETTDDQQEAYDMPFSRNNFILMIAAGILIVLGFVLMAGSPTTVTEYNPDIFSSKRIVVGPLLSFAGFIVMAIAIIVKPKK